MHLSNQLLCPSCVRHTLPLLAPYAASVILNGRSVRLGFSRDQDVDKFISEDDLATFEGWLKYQGIDPATTSPEELKRWREYFAQISAQRSVTPKVGLMKLQQASSEHRYAVAVRDGSCLWLALWVRRSSKPEYFVFMPRADGEWNVHTSYHRDGRLHLKSYGRTVFEPIKCQPLTGAFKGTEHLGAFAGHGPTCVGAICEPSAFSGVVEVKPGVLGPRDGVITVDLVEPGSDPSPFCWEHIVQRKVFTHAIPWVVITVGSVSCSKNK